MIKQLLFNLSKNKIFFNFIDIMGYVPYPISEKNMYKHSYKTYSRSKMFLNNKQKDYKKTAENLLIETVFNLKDTRLNLLSNNIEAAKVNLRNANKTFLRANNITNSGKKMFDYTQQLISLEIDCVILFNEIESKILPYFSKIQSNKQKLESIFLAYKDMKINSTEHLELSKNHLELVVENIQLTTMIEDNLTKDNKEEAMQLIHRLNVFKNRMIDNNIVQLENGFLIRNRSNIYNSMLYLRACAESTKLKFYLQYDKKELFDEVHEMVKNQVFCENFEPLIFYSNVNINEVYTASPYSNHHYFNKYINSFVAKIDVNNNSNVSISLKQIENIELLEEQ